MKKGSFYTSRLEWDDSYNIDMVDLDVEHRIILLFMNEISVEMDLNSKESSKETQIKLFREFLNYYKHHVKNEEDLFDKYFYPEKNAHVKDHERISNELQELISSVLVGEQSSITKMNNLVQEWITEHIMVFDQKFATYYFEVIKGEK